MKKKVYIHMGFHKTGTTSLQECLHKNVQLLSKHGIYYPSIHSNHSIFFYAMFAYRSDNWYFNRVHGCETKQKAAKLSQHYCQKLEKAFSNSKITKVILSGEELSVFGMVEVEKLSRWIAQYSDDVTILCGLRNPVDWYSSCVQELLKTRRAPIETICKNMAKNRLLGYYRLFPYIDCFGEQAVKVFDFDRRKKDLCGHFMKLCEAEEIIKNPKFDQGGAACNVSLSHGASLLLDSLNRLKPCVDPVQLEHEALRNQLLQLSGRKFKLPDRNIQQLLAVDRSAIEKIAGLYEDECGYYTQSFQQSENQQSEESGFHQEEIDGVALLVADLIQQLEQLKNPVKVDQTKQESLMVKLKKVIFGLVR